MHTVTQHLLFYGLALASERCRILFLEGHTAALYQLIQLCFFVDIVVFFRKLSLLLQLNQLPGGLLHGFQVGFTSGDGCVEKSHLQLTQGFIEVQTSISADKPLGVLIRITFLYSVEEILSL